MNENLIYDQPECAGAENVLRRAKRFLETEWEPVMEFSCNEGNYLYSTRSGKKHTSGPYRSMPYSSCRVRDKFIGIEVSHDTFLTALQNPASVLYTSDLSDFDEPAFNGTISNTYMAYGVVCSSFANYVLDMPVHRSTREWDIAPELYLVENQSADGLKLCDTVTTTMKNGRSGGHVRVVTGIARDEEGHVRKVEISEGRPPVVMCQWYTAEEFEATLTAPNAMYKIYRCKHLESVTCEPTRIESGYVPGREIMLDYGDFSVYTTKETICFNINCKADTLVVEGTGAACSYDVKNLPGECVLGQELKLFRISGLPAGQYEAYGLIEGEKTRPVHFHVAELPDINVVRNDGTPFARIPLKPVAPDGEALTEQSACFYKEDGSLHSKPVTIALFDGKNLIPARCAVRKKDGTLYLRMAAMFEDEHGKKIQAFSVEDNITLYAYHVREQEACKVLMNGAKACKPYSLVWKEEAAIAYQQRLFTAEECTACSFSSEVEYYENAFAHLSVFCKTEYGIVATEPIPFVIER